MNDLDFFRGGLMPMERAFRDFVKPTRFDVMKTDVHEKDGLYTLSVEVPGYKKEDIKIDLLDGTLVISAEHNETKEEKDEKGNLIRSERSFGSCSRSFYVGENIKASDVKAKFDNGMLTVVVPSSEQKQIESKETISIK